MERIVYDRMAELDEKHWWYRARRTVLRELIRRRIRLPEAARILEVGCGTGHNFQMLGQFGRLDAIEVDGAARAIASRRLGHAVMDAPLPQLPGVPAHAYDMIAMLDVLEHIDEDRAALASLAARLRPNGRILITVPAHPWMWSAHDEVNHHKRRYTRRTLAAAARLAGRVTGKEDSDDKLPPAPVNRLFEVLFGLERYASGRVPLPPGVSLAAIVSAS